MIKNISASKLKGKTFSHNFNKLNVIYGKNYSGKTTILDAIRIGMLGYLPELGKTPKASFMLSSGNEMDVSISYKDDNIEFTTEKEWINGKTISFKNDTPVPNDILSSISSMLNPNEYFDKSEKEKINYVLNKVSSLKLNLDSLIKKIREIPNYKGNVVESEIEQVFNEVLLEDDDVKIDKLLDSISVLKKNVAANIKQLQNTVNSIHENDTILNDLIDFNRKDVSDQLELFKNEYSELQNKIGSLNEQLSSLRKTESELNYLKNMSFEYFDRTIEDDKIKEIQNEITKNTNIQNDIIDNLNSLREEIDLLNNDFQKFLKSHKDELNNDSEVIFKLTKEISDLDKLVEFNKINISKIEKEISDSLNIDECPVCGSHANVWKDKYISLRKDQLKKLINENDEHELSINKKKNEININKQALDEKNKIFNNSKDELQKNINFKQDLINSNNSKLNDLKNNVLILENKINQIKRYILQGVENNKKMAEAKQSLMQLKDFDPNLISFISNQIDETNARLEYLKNGINDKTIILNKFIKIDSQKEIIAEYENKIISNKDAVPLIKNIELLINSEKKTLVSRAFGQILNPANKLIKDIMKYNLEYFNGDIGYKNENNSWVSIKSFSGTESALTYIGVAAGIASISPFKIILIDELAKLDKDNRVKLIERIGEMIKDGDIHQFFGVIPEDSINIDEINIDKSIVKLILVENGK